MPPDPAAAGGDRPPAGRPRRRELLRAVLLLTAVRLVVNVTRRFAYPFLPAIGRQLGVGLPAVQAAVGLQSAVGIGSPLLGPLADRHGRKRVMVLALAPLAPVALLAALLPTYVVFVAALVVFGAGKMVFDPALQAYLGDRVRYGRRGLALGATELSWAGSLLVAAPATGALLAGPGLGAVLLLIGGLLLVAWVALVVLLPDDRRAADGTGAATGPGAAATVNGAAAAAPAPRRWWDRLRASEAARGALGYSLLLVAANEVFLINYGAWMEASFGLGPTLLGAATVTIALAETGGELVVVGLADRLGKRRLALWGAAVSSLCYLAVPLAGARLAGGLALVLVMFVGVEVAIVASIPLFTEVLPEARAVMMSANVGAHALGRVLGAAAGGLLHEVAGGPATMVLAALLGGAAWALLRRRVPEAGTAGAAAQGRS